MANYDVEVCRIGYAVRTLNVEGENALKAVEAALDEAGDHLYNEHHADYEVNMVINRDTDKHEEVDLDGVADLNLEVIQHGLAQSTVVSEHCGNHPMTDAYDRPYDSDSDPMCLLGDAATMASRIIDALIANPELAAKVARVIKNRE